MSSEAITISGDVPYELKVRLIELSRRLPEPKRAPFLRNTLQRLAGVADENRNLFTGAVIGWVAGQALEQTLTFPIPFIDVVIEVLNENTSELLGLAGGAVGFNLDAGRRAKEKKELDGSIDEVLREEFRKAMA